MRWLSISVAVMSALVLAACSTTGRAPLASRSPQVLSVGYAPAQAGLEAVAARRGLDAYTHINIAFANPDANGQFVGGAALTCMGNGKGGMTTLAAFRTMVASGHQAGARVLVSLGGGIIPACSADWTMMLQPGQRHRLVRQIVRLVEAEKLDGIDIDLEGALLTRIDAAGDFTPFAAELGRALKRRGKMLTCATASYEGGMIPRSSIPSFDLVNVMAYDAVGPTWGVSGGEHAPLDQAASALALWRARGVAKEHLVLGVPFYGYGYGALKGSYPYRVIASQYGPDMSGDTVGARCAGCSYITFNGVDTLREKARLSVAEGAGFMVWELTQDTDDGLLVHSMLGEICSGDRMRCGERSLPTASSTDVAAGG